jgi:nucleotide-binding universal stress UspA family protein
MLTLDDTARPPRIIIEHGSPATVILEKIVALQPEVVVLGARHPARSRLAAHLPWSTTTRVIAEAQCPVLTVRELD